MRLVLGREWQGEAGAEREQGDRGPNHRFDATGCSARSQECEREEGEIPDPGGPQDWLLPVPG